MSGLLGHCESNGIEMLGTDISEVMRAICFPDLDLMNRKSRSQYMRMCSILMVDIAVHKGGSKVR